MSISPSTTTTNGAGGESLARRTGKGALWLFGSRVWSQLMSLTIGVALARLLDPADFGLLGIVMVVTGLFGMLADMGLSTAIVQKQDLSEAELSSAFWFNLGVSVAIAAVLAVCSPLIASFNSAPAVVPIMCVVAFTFPVSSLSSVHYALLQKALRFSDITKVNVISSLVAGLAALAAAGAGWNVWALVVQQMMVSVGGTVGVCLYSGWRPHWSYSWKNLSRIWHFGLNLTGFQVVNYFSRNFDKFLIGKYLGSNQLGLYNLAYVLMGYPLANLISVAQGVLFPAFSEVQNDTARLANAYIKSCRYLSFVILPVMAGLALVAREAVAAIYGPKWSDAGSVLAILSWVGTFQPFASLAGSVVLVRGLARWFFWWGLVVSTTNVLSFLIGLRWGIIGIATCYLISQVLLTVIGMPIQYRKVGISVRKLMAAMAEPGAATIMMCAAVLAVGFIFNMAHRPAVFRLCVSVGTGVLVYVWVLFLLRKTFWSELCDDLRRAFRSR